RGDARLRPPRRPRPRPRQLVVVALVRPRARDGRQHRRLAGHAPELRRERPADHLRRPVHEHAGLDRRARAARGPVLHLGIGGAHGARGATGARPGRGARGHVRDQCGRLRCGDGDVRRIHVRPGDARLLHRHRTRPARPHAPRIQMTTAVRAMRTDLDEGSRAMARGAATNLGGALLTNVLSFALLLVTTHVVAVAEVGLLTLATTVITLALVPAVLGLDTGAVRYVARAAGLGDERAARGACQSAVGVVAIVSTALALALFVNADRLAELVHKPASVTLIRISVLGLPGLAISRVALAA